MPARMSVPVVILCGGRGTRLQEHTHAIPKALVEIGGRPILWHVMQLYASQGFDRFILTTGYLGDQVAAFARSSAPGGTTVECVDTGLETPTGGRLAQVADRVADGTFCLTYADGVADIDLGAELDFHRAHGALATITLVRPELPFGVARLNGGDEVRGFREKPRSEHWVNGGFLVFEPGVLDVVGPDSVLEREPLERLAAAGQLRAYRHEGFWDCMDTYKDAVMLNDLWESGEPPWRTW